ncbi:ABC transporter substrate-binding protein [Roseateles sp.]|uniref:ABC transporter substrate-binding protein n=1 Tax=Roseateles sp. TaxID=1971397 RepID=UPI0031D94CD3
MTSDEYKRARPGRGRALPLAVLLLAWLLAFLMSVVGASSARAAERGDDSPRELRVAMQLEPPLLDPTAGAASPIGELVYGNVFEGLLTLGEDGQPKPGLASAWEVLDDGLRYRFQLRAGVRFHDGTPFDAAVAKFALDRARAPDSPNPQRTALSAIERVDVIAPLMLELRLRQRSGRLPVALAAAAAVMVAPGSADTNRTAPVGTGPWRFDSWRRGDSVLLRRNDAYWGPPAPLERLRFRFIPDPTAAYAALMAGDIDLFPNFPSPENLAQFRADRRFAVEIGSSEGETLLAFNHRQPLLAQLAVRRAISHAIDRRALIDGAMFGYGEPIGSHFPPRNAAYLDLTGASAYDPALARRLLAEAGVKPADVAPLRMKLPPTFFARRCGEILAAQLAAIGLRVEIQNLEWAQWLDQVYTRHDFDLTVIVHAEAQDFDIYGREGYYFGYRSPAYQALLKQLDATADPTAQRELLQALQRRLSEDAANGFLFQYPRLLVRRAGLHGLTTSGVGNIELGGVYFDDGLSDGDGGAASKVHSAGAAKAGVAGADGAVRSRDPRQGTDRATPARWPFLALGAIGAGLAVAWLVWVARRCSASWLAARALSLVITLSLASFMIFALVQLAPGDPARHVLGLQADESAVVQLRQQLGLDAPWPRRYLNWIAGLPHGDFGQSATYQVPVSGLLLERLPLSLPLALYALLLAIVIATPAGLAAAWRPGSRLDRWIDQLSQLGLAVPNFWLGLLLSLVFAVGLRWVPAGGFQGWGQGLPAGLAGLALPALALALPQAAILARVLRGSLLDLGGEDFLRTARAKGAGRWRVLWRHALPNAALPLLTLLGLQLSFLLAGSVIIENVFFLPGLGRLLFQAVAQRDLVLVQSLVLLLVSAVVLLSFIVDLSGRAADPRLARAGGQA